MLFVADYYKIEVSGLDPANKGQKVKLAKYLGIIAGLSALILFIENTTDNNVLAGLATLITVSGLMLAMKA